MFDTNSRTGIHHTHELAKIAKKHNFIAISRMEFLSAIFVYDFETAPSGEFLNLANTRDKNTLLVTIFRYAKFQYKVNGNDRSIANVICCVYFFVHAV